MLFYPRAQCFPKPEQVLLFPKDCIACRCNLQQQHVVLGLTVIYLVSYITGTCPMCLFFGSYILFKCWVSLISAEAIKTLAARRRSKPPQPAHVHCGVQKYSALMLSRPKNGNIFVWVDVLLSLTCCRLNKGFHKSPNLTEFQGKATVCKWNVTM